MLQNAPDVAQVLAEESHRSGRRRRMVWLVLATTAIVAALLGWWWFSGASDRSVQNYVTEPAALADIRVIVVATGTLEPTGEADVSSVISGTIESVSARPNDQVSKGQVLARLDMGDLDARLSGAIAMVSSQQANLLVAEANLADAEAALARTQALSSGQSVSVRELELAASSAKRAQAQHALAEAQLRAAQADLQAARNDYDKACICSPIDGIVLESNVDPGQAITSAGLGQPLFSLAEDLTRLNLQVDIDEADIGSVQEGDTASFAVEAWTQRPFSGVIREIRYAPISIEGVVSYRAMLDVDNSEMLLRPGMTATADIVVDEVRAVLSVPNAALRFSPAASEGTSFQDGIMPSSTVATRDGSERTVWVLRDAELTQVPVTVGVTDGQVSEITEGALTAGDLVVVGQASN
ncbi:MAG TPA: efflux RND transporter periplasmic adaptor subunit [Devosia sp.]|nr:efflux RND transporter periplasmic adaptor subunit [Devosia sp.]